MEQSQKDAATKAAWITGGFSLAGTLITLLFTGGVLRDAATGTKSPPLSGHIQQFYVCSGTTYDFYAGAHPDTTCPA